MSPSPNNITRFNTGKDANELKISYFVCTCPDSELRRSIFSPISNDLPCLTPIMRNIRTWNFFEEIEKNKYFCFFSQEKTVKSTFRISENTKRPLGSQWLMKSTRKVHPQTSMYYSAKYRRMPPCNPLIWIHTLLTGVKQNSIHNPNSCCQAQMGQ